VVVVAASAVAVLVAEALAEAAASEAEADSNKPRYNTLKTSYNKEMRQERLFLPLFLLVYFVYNTKAR
jgi:hypothetical protein